VNHGLKVDSYTESPLLVKKKVSIRRLKKMVKNRFFTKVFTMLGPSKLFYTLGFIGLTIKMESENKLDLMKRFKSNVYII